MFKSHKPGREQVLMTDRVSNLWRMTSINQSQAGHEGQAVIRSVCLTKLKSFLSSFPRSQLCVASAAPPTVVTSLCSVKGECDSQCGRGRGNGLLLSHDRTPAALWRYTTVQLQVGQQTSHKPAFNRLLLFREVHQLTTTKCISPQDLEEVNL